MNFLKLYGRKPVNPNVLHRRGGFRQPVFMNISIAVKWMRLGVWLEKQKGICEKAAAFLDSFPTWTSSLRP
jgi:predicted transcriptional regulator